MTGDPVNSYTFTLRPVDRKAPAVLAALLEVYRQCEDFLALGPQPHASPEMVQADLDLSQAGGGHFYGIYLCPSDEMVGVADYIPCGFEGIRQHAFIELLMIAQPFRGRGLGERIVDELEALIRKDPLITVIRLGCQINNPGGLRFWQRCGYRITGPAVRYPDQTTGYPLEKLVDRQIL
jgi:ribosomal protein S18 acetylase RimI-like enzyme